MDYIRVGRYSPEIIELYDMEEKSKEDEEKLVELVVKFINDNKTPYSNSSANDIDWINRVEIQSIIQKYTTHSISSTINLPETATEEEVSEIYIKSWEKNLKGVTIYRDGCRSGVLITKKEDVDDEIAETNAPKRPKIVECEIHHPKLKGETHTVLVGLLKGKPYEVFALDVEIGKGYTEGTIVKIKSGRYDLVVYDKNGEKETFESINSYMSDIESFATRSTSGNLRHGMHIKYVVELLTSGNGDITSFTKVMARILKKYITDGTLSTKTCGDCGAKNSMIYEEGCSRCKICGSSKCG